MYEAFFQRSRYVEHQRLSASDLENQARYEREKRWLLNRALYGPGIVYGLEIRYSAKRSGMFLSPGLAFDPQGRELFLSSERYYPLSQLVGDARRGAQVFLCLRHTERDCGEGYVLTPEGVHSSIPNRIAEDLLLLALSSPTEQDLPLAGLSYSPREGSWRVYPLCPLVRPGIEKASASGVLILPLPPGALAGEIFYSHEIAHTLGPGNVQIRLAVEGRLAGRRCCISGQAGLFHVGCQTAAALFPDSGSFSVAVRLQQNTRRKRQLRIRWFAWRPGAEQSCQQAGLSGAAQQTIPAPCETPAPPTDTAASPDMLRLEPQFALLQRGESAQFALYCGARPAQELPALFSAEQGEIDDSGYYRAPEQAGVYSIRAAVAGPPVQEYTAFVVVAERR